MNFESKNSGRWFWFDDKSPDSGGLCLRILTVDESRRIDKLTTKSKFKPIRGQMTEIKTVDEELRDRLVWDYCVMDWKGVCLDGKSLEPNTDTKVLMMKNNTFAVFFLDKVSELNDELEMSKELLEKNLETSSSGSVEPIVKDA